MTKKNYVTVTGSATVKISPINAVVTITGNNSTADYDEKEHTVTGYTAYADTALYDVEKDFTFSGNALVSLTDVGIVKNRDGAKLLRRDFLMLNQTSQWANLHRYCL